MAKGGKQNKGAKTVSGQANIKTWRQKATPAQSRRGKRLFVFSKNPKSPNYVPF
jgi:hypothetical protein